MTSGTHRFKNGLYCEYRFYPGDERTNDAPATDPDIFITDVYYIQENMTVVDCNLAISKIELETGIPILERLAELILEEALNE